MEILNEGYLNKQYTRICECPYCGCVFQINETHLHIEISLYNVVVDHDKNYKAAAACPQNCGYNIEIPVDKLPIVVFNRIFKRETTIVKYKNCKKVHFLLEMELQNAQFVILCDENHMVNESEIGPKTKRMILE